MDEHKLLQQIGSWLHTYHASTEHQAILQKVLMVGKPSKSWVETIQRHISEVAHSTPDRGDIKRACRILLEQHTNPTPDS